MSDNNYEKMKQAEFRGFVGATLESLEKGVEKINEKLDIQNAKINTNHVEIEKIKAVDRDNKLSWKSRATIIAAAIMAVSAVIVALVN